uniref:hypothetical protein n=1 Tax=Fulvivirga sp. TaxID=1931237 RepID=UPI004049C0A5
MKKIMNIAGARQLSKNEQKNVMGGMMGETWPCPAGCCCPITECCENNRNWIPGVNCPFFPSDDCA